mmetsp:Transcript_4381/g.7691  ORF Transcript_4381/g.7691 Transcript_4381/m.7691 type:complete len:111 (-) Transcript_4381:1017-1349(-)
MRNLSWMSRLMRGRPGTSSTKRLPTRGGPGGHHEEEVFNEPGGKLFGEEPLKPGERRKWEDWELPWYVFCAGCAFFAYSAIFVRDNAPWNVRDSAMFSFLVFRVNFVRNF